MDVVIPIQAASTSSGTMQTDITPFRDGFPDFLDRLNDLEVNYQIAVVQESDGCVYGTRPFLSSAMSQDEQLSILDDQLDGSSIAHGLVVAMEATKTGPSAPGGCDEGLVRDTARLAVFGYTYVGENHPDYGWKATVDPIVKRKKMLPT